MKKERGLEVRPCAGTADMDRPVGWAPASSRPCPVASSSSGCVVPADAFL